MFKLSLENLSSIWFLINSRNLSSFLFQWLIVSTFFLDMSTRLQWLITYFHLKTLTWVMFAPRMQWSTQHLLTGGSQQRIFSYILKTKLRKPIQMTIKKILSKPFPKKFPQQPKMPERHVNCPGIQQNQEKYLLAWQLQFLKS